MEFSAVESPASSSYHHSVATPTPFGGATTSVTAKGPRAFLFWIRLFFGESGFTAGGLQWLAQVGSGFLGLWWVVGGCYSIVKFSFDWLQLWRWPIPPLAGSPSAAGTGTGTGAGIALALAGTGTAKHWQHWHWGDRICGTDGGGTPASDLRDGQSSRNARYL
jgi:hypothetical protein